MLLFCHFNVVSFLEIAHEDTLYQRRGLRGGVVGVWGEWWGCGGSGGGVGGVVVVVVMGGLLSIISN